MRGFRKDTPLLAPLITSRNLSVLVIDPNEEHQTLSVTALGRKGFRAAVADTGREGIRVATQDDFDAIVIDAKVKDPGAFDVLRYLVERVPKVPKILVVSPGAEDTALRGLASGAASYLVKTPRYNELLPAEVSAQIERGRERHLLETQQRTLWETVDTLRTLFRASPLAIAVLDREANVKLWSGAAEKLFGWSEEEVLGRPIPIIPPDRQEEFRRNLDRVERGEPLIAEEMRRMRKDGSLMDIEATIVLLQDSAGATTGKLAVYTDISARKQSEADLRRSNRALRTLSACNQALVLAEDETTLLQQVCEIIVASGYRLAWVGLPQDDAGRTIKCVAVAGAGPMEPDSWFVSWADEGGAAGPTATAAREGRISVIDDLPESDGSATAEGPMRATGCSSAISFPLILAEAPHGTLTIYATERAAFGQEEISLFTTLADNLRYGMTALRERSIRQRTQRDLEESERKFRTLFEAAADAILLVDSDGVVRDVNEAATALFQRSRSELLAHRLGELVPPEDAEREATYVRAGFDNASGPLPLEAQVRRPDGSRRYVEVHARRIPEAVGGAASEFVVRDITDRKEFARRMEESERLASLGQMAAYVAHEVNTPLANISLLSASIGRKVEDAEVVDKLRKIDTQRRRAANIITDLLSFSKHREITPVDADLGGLVIAAVEQCVPYCKPEVTLRADLSERPVRIQADRAQIEIVVVNLVKNALEATSHGFVNVRIEERDEGPTIVVEDTGKGMSREVLDRLYEPFFTTKKRGEGTGLGLSWSRKLVEAHGGRIEVISELGKGSIFTVVLPRPHET